MDNETPLERARRELVSKPPYLHAQMTAILEAILDHLEAQASAAQPLSQPLRKYLEALETEVSEEESVAISPPATESNTRLSPSDAALSPAEKLWQERHPAASVQQQYKAGYWLREQELIAPPTPRSLQSAPQGTESGSVDSGSECAHKWESWATKKPYMPVSWCSQCGVLAYNGRIRVPAAATGI